MKWLLKKLSSLDYYLIFTELSLFYLGIILMAGIVYFILGYSNQYQGTIFALLLGVFVALFFLRDIRELLLFPGAKRRELLKKQKKNFGNNAEVFLQVNVVATDEQTGDSFLPIEIRLEQSLYLECTPFPGLMLRGQFETSFAFKEFYEKIDRVTYNFENGSWCLVCSEQSIDISDSESREKFLFRLGRAIEHRLLSGWELSKNNDGLVLEAWKSYLGKKDGFTENTPEF